MSAAAARRPVRVSDVAEQHERFASLFHPACAEVERLVEIRAMVGSRRHNVGVTSLETLTDILVHGQDMAIPLQRDLEMPTAASAAAADRVWSYGGKGKARVFDTG